MDEIGTCLPMVELLFGGGLIEHGLMGHGSGLLVKNTIRVQPKLISRVDRTIIVPLVRPKVEDIFLLNMASKRLPSGQLNQENEGSDELLCPLKTYNFLKEKFEIYPGFYA